MATNGKNPFRQLLADVAELKATSRSLSETMRSLSDTTEVIAKTMAVTAKTMTAMSKKMTDQEHLYERVAKVLIVLKDQTDERFAEVDERLEALEAFRH